MLHERSGYSRPWCPHSHESRIQILVTRIGENHEPHLATHRMFPTSALRPRTEVLSDDDLTNAHEISLCSNQFHPTTRQKQEASHEIQNRTEI